MGQSITKVDSSKSQEIQPQTTQADRIMIQSFMLANQIILGWVASLLGACVILELAERVLNSVVLGLAYILRVV